ncbi:hypothetical protein GQ53DRAFT_803762 [Thozetella sp. PMI_491]|nr:hypothetical protein GQ53DRAFT_803762 [Thozetella sp. PMI_491]
MSCKEVFQVVGDGHVDFFLDSVYEIQENISRKCTSDPRLAEWRDGLRVLTMNAVRNMTGSTTGWMSIWQWTPYQGDLILSRLQAWKLPLVQLLMLFPRPPHGTMIELFSIVHLMGDPVDTSPSSRVLYCPFCRVNRVFEPLALRHARVSLTFTLQVTQRRMQILSENRMERENLKGLTLLINAFEECGEENNVLELERHTVRFARRNTIWNENPHYQATAHALAADRTTSLLPVITAVITFLASIALSYGKTLASDWSDRNPRHVEIYGIAFSMTLASWPCIVKTATMSDRKTTIHLFRYTSTASRLAYQTG